MPGNPTTINRFFPALGNHDYSDGGGLAEYLSYFTLPGAGIPAGSRTGQERYYDFIQGPVHLLVSTAWARSKVGPIWWPKNGSKRVWQPPRRPGNWSFCITRPIQATHGPTAVVHGRTRAWGADAVLAGHDHTYERLQIGEIPYFVNGLAG